MRQESKSHIPTALPALKGKLRFCGSAQHGRKQRQPPLKPKRSQAWPFGPYLPAEGAHCWHLVFTKSLGVLFSRSTAASPPKLLAVSPPCNFLIELSCQAFSSCQKNELAEGQLHQLAFFSMQNSSQVQIRDDFIFLTHFSCGSTSFLWKRTSLEM